MTSGFTSNDMATQGADGYRAAMAAAAACLPQKLDETSIYKSDPMYVRGWNDAVAEMRKRLASKVEQE